MFRFIIAALMLSAVPSLVISQSIDQSSYSEMLTTAKTEGEVPIIVMFKKPKHTPDKGWVNLNDYIEDIQRRGLNEIGWKNFNDLVKFSLTPAVALTVTASELDDLTTKLYISGIYENKMLKPLLRESTQVVGATKAWQYNATGKGQVVAVIDTGVDSKHEFLKNKVIDEACFSTNKQYNNALIASTCPNGNHFEFGSGAAQPCENNCFHGTHVAGIVAGSYDGIAGVAPDAELLAVNVFSYIVRNNNVSLNAMTSDVMLGLEWILKQKDKHNIAAVNMSLGGGSFPKHCDGDVPLTDLINQLTDAGIAVVIASGNDGESAAINSPACISKAIAVGATDTHGHVTDFSNSANIIDILAPGSNVQFSKPDTGIHSSIPGNNYARYPGTSMAAPHVAGAFALLREIKPNASVNELTELLCQTGTLIRDSKNGLEKPRLQVDSTIEKLKLATKTKPTPKPNEMDNPVEKPKQTVESPIEQPAEPTEPPKNEVLPVAEKTDKPTPVKIKSVKNYDGIKVFKDDTDVATDKKGKIKW